MVASSPRYLRVEFEAVDSLTPSVDDAEFYFTPGDALVQFRCARRSGFTDFGASRRRMDSIRIALQFESVGIKDRQAVNWPRNLDMTRTKDIVVVRGLGALWNWISFFNAKFSIKVEWSSKRVNCQSITYIFRKLQNYRGVIWIPYATFILNQFTESTMGVLLLKHFPAGGYSFFIWILSLGSKTLARACLMSLRRAPPYRDMPNTQNFPSFPCASSVFFCCLDRSRSCVTGNARSSSARVQLTRLVHPLET